MQRGLNNAEFQKIKIIPYKPIYGDMGFTRCSICLNEFNSKEKLKQFPKCEHLFHIKCLDIWLNIEPTCPNCLLTYKSINASTESINSENFVARVHPNILNNNNGINNGPR